eukprot:2757579-Prymnesium_polylepis.2
MSAYLALRTAGVVGIVGPAMSSLSVPVATVGGLDMLPSLSYWSSSPTLADKEAYPFFARTFPSDDMRAPLILEALTHFNFTNFAVIHVSIRLPHPQDRLKSAPHTLSSHGPRSHPWQTDEEWGNALVSLLVKLTGEAGSSTRLVSSFSFDFNDDTSVRAAVRRAAEMSQPVYAFVSSKARMLRTLYRRVPLGT